MLHSSFDAQRRLLVFDCHEAWVHQLGGLNQPMDIVIALPGRHIQGWDTAMRPLPPNARIVSLAGLRAQAQPYDCIIAHNLTDLLDVKALPGPRLLVLHATLDGVAADQGSRTPPDQLRRAVAQYVRAAGVHVMAISPLKGRSWGFEDDIVPSSASASDYLPFRADHPAGLRVVNHISRRLRTLLWDLHQSAFAGLPITLVGRNDDMPGVFAAADWNHLKEILSHHRFFVHTAEPTLEDGYNMAMLEAMAAGLPVIGNRHPTSPIEHGVSGFLSDDPVELGHFARLLIADRPLAIQMGREAQRIVAERFSPERFLAGLKRSVGFARQKWDRLTRSSRSA